MIEKLPARVSEQLCANQVIVDLPSCIKELIENSLDAGATFVRVDLQEYGKQLIEVTDNGSGIAEQDLANICLKGATSKLPSFERITQLNTLGFRGEALNALKNLACMRIETRTKQDAAASVMSFEAGSQLEKRQVDYPHGSKVTLRNLFKSVPVREKYWHDHCKESALRVVQLLKEYSLSYLNVQFVLVNKHDGRSDILFQVGRVVKSEPYNRKEAWLSRIDSVLGSAIAEHIEYFEDPEFEGWVSRNQLGKINSEKLLKRNVLYMYVNDRPVDFLQTLYRGLEDMFKQWSSFGKFLCIVKLKTQGADISSTPDKRHLFTKEEARLVQAVLKKINGLMEGWYHRPKECDPSLLLRASMKINEKKQPQDRKSKASVTSEVSKYNPAERRRPSEAVRSRFSGMLDKFSASKTEAERSVEKPSGVPSKKQPISTNATTRIMAPRIDNLCVNDQQVTVTKSSQMQVQGDAQAELLEDLVPPINFSKSDFLKLDIVGQFNIGFIVCQLGLQFYLVDQHAASEKTNYERLLRQPMGRMYRPTTLTVSALDAAYIEEAKDQLEGFGYEFQLKTDPYSVEFGCFPIYLNKTFDQNSFLELSRGGKICEPHQHPTIMSRAALQACHAAIRVGDVLNHRQMRELLDGMAELASPWNCPHGRPTIVRLTDPKDFIRGSAPSYVL